MGLPKRVTRKGRPVLRTRSKVARHVALNFEIAIESMLVTIPWSTTWSNIGNATLPAQSSSCQPAYLSLARLSSKR